MKILLSFYLISLLLYRKLDKISDHHGLQRTNGNSSFPDCIFPFFPKMAGHGEITLPKEEIFYAAISAQTILGSRWQYSSVLHSKTGRSVSAADT